MVSAVSPLFPALGFPGVLQAQIATRMVIATHAACRKEPNVSAVRVHTYKLGDLVGATKVSKEEGTSWYFDQWRISGRSPSCWIYGPLTTEFVQSNPEPALLAAIDHVLQRHNEARFEDYVEVDNLLAAGHFSSVVNSSGLLQFRKLSLIHRAIARPDARARQLDREPLKKAWVLSYRDLLYISYDDYWHVRPETFWNLYDKHAQAPWAVDLAWTAAQLRIPGDECYASCVLEILRRTYLQYWTRLPQGPAINQALAGAMPRAKHAADIACSDKGVDYSVPNPLIESFRKSLVDVTAPEKNQLLDYLDQIERKCYPDQR